MHNMRTMHSERATCTGTVKCTCTCSCAIIKCTCTCSAYAPKPLRCLKASGAQVTCSSNGCCNGFGFGCAGAESKCARLSRCSAFAKECGARFRRRCGVTKEAWEVPPRTLVQPKSTVKHVEPVKHLAFLSVVEREDPNLTL